MNWAFPVEPIVPPKVMPLEYLGFYEPQRYQPVQITKHAIFKRNATFMVAFFLNWDCPVESARSFD